MSARRGNASKQAQGTRKQAQGTRLSVGNAAVHNIHPPTYPPAHPHTSPQTCNEWLAKFDANRPAALAAIDECYGKHQR